MSLHTLLVDDDRAFSSIAHAALTQAGFQVTSVPALYGARQALASRDFELILLDRRLPDGDGLKFLPEVLRSQPGVAVVMVTADDDVTSAVEALHLGAKDYVVKPVELEELIFKAQRAAAERQLRDRLAHAEHEIHDRHRLIPPLSPNMRCVLEDLEKIAARPFSPVLLFGETGVGKEVMARYLHSLSAPQGPFVHVNCATIPEASAESELFGHDKGAFTDAKSSRKGLLELADGGTLLLDEIGELNIAMQAKLLTFLDSGEFRRLGASETRRSQCRVIGATHQNLESGTATGKFRSDLWFRLSVFKVSIPALRDRREDIPILAQAFLEKMRRDLGRPFLKLSSVAHRRLTTYPFLGNVRELKNLLERAAVLESGPELNLDVLEESLSRPASHAGHDFIVPGPPLTLEKVEELYVAHVLKQLEGRRMETAQVLGISYPTLAKRLKET